MKCTHQLMTIFKTSESHIPKHVFSQTPTFLHTKEWINSCQSLQTIRQSDFLRSVKHTLSVKHSHSSFIECLAYITHRITDKGQLNLTHMAITSFHGFLVLSLENNLSQQIHTEQNWFLPILCLKKKNDAQLMVIYFTCNRYCWLFSTLKSLELCNI